MRAGIETQYRWGKHRADLLDTLDRLGQATLVCDTWGRVLHCTPALASVLDADPEGEDLLAAMVPLAKQVGTTSAGTLVSLGPPAATAGIRTGLALYRATASRYRSPFASTPGLVLVALERKTPVLRPLEELAEHYHLTKAELKVVTFLVSSRTSEEIARELYVSVHTVRRHTERILLKTGSHSRAELALKILH